MDNRSKRIGFKVRRHRTKTFTDSNSFGRILSRTIILRVKEQSGRIDDIYSNCESDGSAFKYRVD